MPKSVLTQPLETRLYAVKAFSLTKCWELSQNWQSHRNSPAYNCKFQSWNATGTPWHLKTMICIYADTGREVLLKQCQCMQSRAGSKCTDKSLKRNCKLNPNSLHVVSILKGPLGSQSAVTHTNSSIQVITRTNPNLNYCDFWTTSHKLFSSFLISTHCFRCKSEDLSFLFFFQKNSIVALCTEPLRPDRWAYLFLTDLFFSLW